MMKLFKLSLMVMLIVSNYVSQAQTPKVFCPPFLERIKAMSYSWKIDSLGTLGIRCWQVSNLERYFMCPSDSSTTRADLVKYLGEPSKIVFGHTFDSYYYYSWNVPSGDSAILATENPMCSYRYMPGWVTMLRVSINNKSDFVTDYSIPNVLPADIKKR